MPPELQGPQPLVGMPADTGLAPLLAHYGVDIHQEILLDSQYSTNGLVIAGRQGLLMRDPFPLMQVAAAGPTDPLAGLQIVPLPFASRVTPGAADPRRTATLLTESSPTSYLRDQVLPLGPETQFTPGDSKRGPFPTGYALTGVFTSHFAAAPPEPPAEGEAAAAPASTPESPAGTRMIVLGSADFIADETFRAGQQHFLFQNLVQFAPAMLENMVDWLAQDQDLVAARTKAAPRPMEPVTSGTRTAIRWGNSAGTAVALLLVGVGVWAVRERRRRHIRL
jgi:hypothetical protein